jgi:frataxin-like iron-binding protein CyaY
MVEDWLATTPILIIVPGNKSWPSSLLWFTSLSSRFHFGNQSQNWLCMHAIKQKDTKLMHWKTKTPNNAQVLRK